MKTTAILLFACPFLFPVSCASANPVLTALGPVEIQSTHDKFDFIKIDPANHRLLACHSGNGTLDVIDLTTAKLIKSVPTGAAQGVAVDEKNGRYFVSTSKPPKMVSVDSTNLEITGEVALSCPADLITYQPSTNRVFVCNDDKPEMWLIDPEKKTILSTITFPGAGMEDFGFDEQERYIFQCLKDSSQLAKLDPKSGKIVSLWSTTPAEKPHGLAFVEGTNEVLIAGSGKLVMLDLSSGKTVSSVDISLKVDEIAYDAVKHRVYCASGLGTISIVGVERKTLTPMGSVPSSVGAHSIAVDQLTHKVWIAFAAKDGRSYIESFTSK